VIHSRIILQAHTNAPHLPGKALLSVGGMPMAVLAAKRAARDGLEVALATSDGRGDDHLAEVTQAAGIRVFRGRRGDMLGCFARATADLAAHDLCVRLVGDNVLPDADFVRHAIAHFESQDTTYLAATHLPAGLACEVFTVGVLREAADEATLPADREEVTPWLVRNRNPIEAGADWLTGDPDWPRCAVETYDDFQRIATLLDGVVDAIGAPWRDLCAHLKDRVTGGAVPLPRLATPGGWQSVLVLGTVQLGLPYGIANGVGMPDEADAGAILRQAMAAGVTHLDSARAYGLSEARIGAFLAEEGAGLLTVWTKLPPLRPVVGERPSAAAAAAAVEASILRSCYALRQRRLATVLLHDATDLSLGGGAGWRALLALKDEGLIGALGVSVQSPAQLMAAMAEPTVTAVQLPCNLLDWRWREAGVEAALARRPDVVIHIRSSLLQGVLSDGTLNRRPRVDVDLDAVRAAVDAAAVELGRLDRVDLSLAAVRALPWAHGIVVGVDSADQLRRNIELFHRPPLSASALGRLEGLLPRVPAKLLDPAQWG